MPKQKYPIAVCKDIYVVYACGFDRNENENDLVNQNYVAKTTLQKWRCKNDVGASPSNIVGRRHYFYE